MAFNLKTKIRKPNGQMIDTGKTVYEFTLNDIDGKPVNLGDYKGKVLVLVNVASKCGLTPQYEEIEKFERSKRLNSSTAVCVFKIYVDTTQQI